MKRMKLTIIMAISALRTQQKQESECANCSGIVYRQTDSGKIIPVDQRCGVKITPPCYVPDGDGCAYQIYGDNNDEPIARCKSCPLCQSDKIRHKQEPAHNDPLVLDELRQMRGEPVWCKELECYGIVKMEKVGSWANELFLVGTWHNGDAAVNFEYDIKSRGLTLYEGKEERIFLQPRRKNQDLLRRISMGKLIDLTDRTFDMLTVIKRVEDRKPGRPMWLCQCECGNTVVVSSTNLLRTNGTKSCGCLRHTSSPTLIDLRGKTFGKLKVIEKDPDSKPGKAKWVCECKCGNIVSVFSDSLRNGKTRSCGCARSQIKHDLTNQAFGFLKVIEPVKNERIKGNETRWKCLCQNCGRTVEVSSYWLRHSDPYGHCKCTRFNKPL